VRLKKCLTGATLLSRWEKSGRGGTDDETVKLLDGVQRVKVPPGHSRAGRPVASVAHSPGDWWVRSVHSKEAGREGSAPKTRLVAMPTLLTRRKAALGGPLLRGCAGVAGVPSSGHVSTGISQEPRRAPHLLSHRRGTWPTRATGGVTDRWLSSLTTP